MWNPQRIQMSLDWMDGMEWNGTDKKKLRYEEEKGIEENVPGLKRKQPIDDEVREHLEDGSGWSVRMEIKLNQKSWVDIFFFSLSLT